MAFESASPPVVRERVTPFPGTPEQRRHVLYLTGKPFASRYGTQKIATVWFVCEAWMSEAASKAHSLVPSRDPRRREVLLLVELDATTQELAQRIELREMQRNRAGKLKAVQPLPEWSPQEASKSLLGVPALAFLAGFAEVCTHPRAYGNVQARMLWHQSQMDRRLGLS